ncbi:MAG: tetratricopeptide repeat protein [Patescibacteria group bacterium]|jgi:tetratricopeptide (TPR) repeat protein
MQKKILSENFNPDQVHVQAEQLRESGDFVEALKTFETVIVGYQQEGNYAKVVEALQGRFLCYKHLFFLTQDQIYAILGRQDAQSSLEIAERHNLKEILPSCYFRVGEASMLFNDFEKAAENFEKAVCIFPGEGAEKGDWRYHWGEALYRSGKKEEGKEKIFEGLKEIQTNPDNRDSFLIHVWESGAYMKLADLLREDEHETAKNYLTKANKIAQEDDRLILRRRQIEELSQRF